MYRTVVTICTAQWSLYVPHCSHYMYRTVVTICTASLTFTNSTSCPHSVLICLVWIWEQTAIVSLYSINWLVFITEECVYCAVRTGCVTIDQVAHRLNTVNAQYAVLVFRQCHWVKNKLIKTYSVTLRRIRATIVAVEKQWALHNLNVCVYSLRYPVRNAHAPYCHPWPVPLFIFFPHYLICGTIF